MQDYIKLEDFQNIARCANECNGNLVQTRKLYFESYGMDPSEADIKIAMELYGDDSAANRLKDADIPTNTLNEAEENIIIKEEIEIGEESIIKLNDTSEQRIPIIYTTRLDEMQIFKKDFSSLTVDDIVSNVLLESKPKFEKPFQSDKKRDYAFLKTVRKIEAFNKLCTLYGDDISYISLSSSSDEEFTSEEDTSNLEDTSDVEDTSEEENIPLKQLSLIKGPVKPKTANNINSINLCKPCTIPLKPSRKVVSINGKPCVLYDQPSKKPADITNTMTFIKGVRYKIGVGCCVLFKDLKTKTSAFFVFDKNGLFSRTFNELVDSKFYLSTIRNSPICFGLEVDICCWLFREFVLKSLICPISMHIWRYPHSCPSNRCNCCCKNKTLEFINEIIEAPLVEDIISKSDTPASEDLQTEHSKDILTNKNGLITTENSIILDDDIKEVSVAKKTISKEPNAKSVPYQPDYLFASDLKKKPTASRHLKSKGVPAISSDFNNEFLQYTKKENLSTANIKKIKRVKKIKGVSVEKKTVSKQSHAKSVAYQPDCLIDRDFNNGVLECTREDKLISYNKTADLETDPLVVSNLNNDVEECTKKDELTCNNSTNTATGLTDVNDLIGIQILKNYSDMIEFYELSSTENIVKHIEMRSKYLHTGNNFRRAVKLSADSDKVFCCWRKRDAMLRTFEFRYTTIAQFIRTPHPCPPDLCICCCKPSLTKSSPKLEDLANPKYAPKHAYTYTGITKQRRKYLNKIDKMRNSEYEKVTVDPSSVISSNKHISKKYYDPKLFAFELFLAQDDITNETSDPKHTEKTAEKSLTKNPTVLPKNTSNTRTIDNTDVTFIAENKIQTIRVATPPPIPAQPVPALQSLQQPSLQPPQQLAGPSQLIQSNIALPVNNIPPALNPSTNNPLQNNALGPTVSPTVDTIVNSILHRFNDVRLIITPDGDVSAELNQPVQTLSTTELQLLSQILSHAKEQVKQLKAAGHLNSGANTILNPWPANSKSNTNLTPAQNVNIVPNKVNTTPLIAQSKPTAPNINANTNLTAIATHGSIKPSKASNSYKIMTNKENFVEEKLRNDAFQCYTNLSALKQKEYMTSCRSYLSGLKFNPKIGSVFSLNQNANMVQNLQPQTQNKTPVPNTSGVKRKSYINPKKDYSKKRKNEDKIETIDLNVPDSVETPQPSTSSTPITVPVGTSAPLLTNFLNKPYAMPAGVMPVNQIILVTGTLPNTVLPILPLAPPCTIQTPNNDPVSETITVADDDDCILGY